MASWQPQSIRKGFDLARSCQCNEIPLDMLGKECLLLNRSFVPLMSTGFLMAAQALAEDSFLEEALKLAASQVEGVEMLK